MNRQKAESVFASDPWHGLWGRGPTFYAACLWCFCVTWPVSIVEIAGIPLMLATAIRIHRNYRFIPSILLQPLLLSVVAFGIVQFVSGYWTLDRVQWLEQAGSIRWLWSLFMLWPFIERRRTLILCLAAGCLVGNATQLSQFLHDSLGWPTPTWSRAPDRVSGWWPPVVCGTVLSAMLGLHLPALILPASRNERVLAVAGTALSLLGILASGTRGAWLAAAALCACAIPALLVIRLRAAGGTAPGKTSVVRVLAVLVALALVGAGLVLWTPLGQSALRRAALARDDIAAAVQTSNYTTDTGARIGMAIWAVDLFHEHPLGGVGAGSYRPAVRGMLESRGINPDTQSVHDHAHNAILHVAATTGLLGLIPALGVVIFALCNAASLGRRAWKTTGPYEWGPFFALLGMLFISAFDTVQVNAQTSALLAVLLSLCPTFVPGRSPYREAAA